jgi:hypothetical protein
MVRILSFDCANKSLAAVGVEWDDNWRDKYVNELRRIHSLYKGNLHNIQSINELYNELRMLEKETYKQWDIKYTLFCDLLPGKKVVDTKPNERCIALKNKIAEINRNFPDPDIVLIEDQMTPNEKSRGVFYCLVYEYYTKVVIMDPKRKNSFNFGAGCLNEYILKYSSAWAANKAHVKENFKKFLKLVDREDIIKKHKIITDVGDALFQLIGYTYSKSVCN